MLLSAVLKMETVAALLLAWGMVFILPIRWVCKHFLPTEPAPEPDAVLEACSPSRDGARARAVARRIERIAPAMPFTTTCLVRAVAGAMLLRRRGLKQFAIRFGVRKTAAGLEAHAWLVHQGAIILGGGSDMDGFTPLTAIPAEPSATVFIP